MTTAVVAVVLMLTLSAVALISRWLVTPSGSHRADRTTPPAIPPTDLGWCPAEEQQRLHAYSADGSRTCWTCRTRTPGGTE